MFAPLYIKTDYSLLTSMIKIDDLISYAKKNNIKALTITDDNLSGVFEFYQKCQANNIKPIIGLEILYNDNVIVLYAQNFAGYQALIQLKKDEINETSLNEVAENLICIIPFASYGLFKQLNKIFKNIYIGVSDNKEQELVDEGRVVYLKPVLYLEKAEKKYLRYLMAIKKGVTVADIPPIKGEFHLPVASEISDIDLENNQQIVESCNIVFPELSRQIPIFSETDSYELLKKLCKEGLRKKIGDVVPKQYIERLKHELQIIRDMAYADYFLIVQDFINYAKKNNILVGPGRGSAAGSLISYCLGITEVDPLKYQLYFERFLNPKRISLPDIDIDIEDNRREEIIHYCIEKYGHKRVAPIITFGTLGAKQVLRDVGRVLNIDLNVIDQLCKKINPQQSLLKNYQNQDVQSFINQKDLKDVYQIALQFSGLKRHHSIHAAGVIMSEKPLDEIIPLIKKENGYLAAYSMEYLEALGLLKIDFLGLKNLTIIQEILTEIKQNFSDIPLNDEKTIRLFQNGDTLGIFQFESPGMIKFLQNLKPTSFADIYAALALFRPGPMKSIDSFIKRKHQQEKINYFHPDLEPILKETYGIIVYQEQIMQIAHVLADYDMGQADILRKAMSKKDTALMAEEKVMFLEKATKKGYEKQLSEQIFSLIAKFAEYGFNKAHSVSYAMISYKMAYLKANYPYQFMSVVLNNALGSLVKTKELINECKKFNIMLNSPHINKSENYYKATKNSIQLPLSMIKNVSKQVSEIIIKERNKKQFTDVFDFMQRLDLHLVNQEVIESLIYVGAFDDLGFNRQTLINNLEKFINYGDLMVGESDETILKPEIKEYEEFSADQLLQHELEYLGIYLTEHPVTKYKLSASNVINLNKVSNYFDQHVEVIGMIQKFNEINTKKNEAMAFLVIVDEYDSLELILFPKVYEKQLYEKDMIIKASGKIEKRYDHWQLIVSKINILKK